MKSITISVTDEMYDRLVNAARENGRSLAYEAVRRVSATLSQHARARAAKIAILAASLEDAKTYARAHGWQRDRWFYAYSVESCTGRYVREIVSTGAYRGLRSHEAIMRELRGGILAAQSIHRQAAELGE